MNKEGTGKTKRAFTVLGGALGLGLLYLSSLYHYLLFHSLAEMFSIVIGCGIFMMAWNARHFLNNGYLKWVGVACLFVAALDLAHTLAYRGMEIFPPDGGNLATQLWIAARLMESGSLLVAPLLLRVKLKSEWAVAGYAAVTLGLLWSIFVGKVFPECYVAGVGLTAFKRASEYVICVVLAGAIGLLVRNRRAFEPQVLRWLVWSVVLTIGSELAFTFYVGVYDLSNQVGHYLKIISFYLIYKAIIETGLSRPYALLLRELKQREAQLALSNENLEKVVGERTAKLKEAVDELTLLSYTITHDMRAPLRAMQGFSAMVLEDCRDCATAPRRELLVRISGAAKRMDALITDALQYTKAVRQEFELRTVDVGALVRGMIESYPHFHAAADRIQVDPNIPRVFANEAGLTQCFSNLLDNALKFVPPGGEPRVRVWGEVVRRGEGGGGGSGEDGGWRMEDGGGDKARTLKSENLTTTDEGQLTTDQTLNSQPSTLNSIVRVWIEDDGIGIDKRYHKKIWQMFEQLDKSYRGTGIGLALVRKVVERMGGRAGVESELGHGSRFWIELKSAPPSETAVV